MKKIIASFLIAFGLWTNTASAFIVFDPTQFSTQVLQYGLEIAGNITAYQSMIKEYALDPLAYAIAQRVKNQIKQEIVKWAQDGGSGKPQFLENPERFFTNLATQELTLVKRDLMTNIVGNDAVLKALVSGNAEGYVKKSFQEFMVPTTNKVIQNDICSPAKLQKMASENAAGAAEFARRYCGATTSTSSQQQQYKDLQNCFAKDFSCGGWNAFLSITQDPYRNTETGRLAVAQLQLQQNVNQKTTNTNNELNRGGGFFSQKVCKKGALLEKDDQGEPLPKESQLCTEYETLTPGDQIRNLTNEVLGDPLKQLQQSDEISEIIVSALMVKLQSIGLRHLKDGFDNLIRGATDGSGSLRDSVTAAGAPKDPTVASSSVTLSNADHRNLTANMLQLMNSVLKEHSTNLTVVQEELTKYQNLADKIVQIETCYQEKSSWLAMPPLVKTTVDSQKQIIGQKVLALADEFSTYKEKADDLSAAIETVTRSRDADAITNIYNAFNAELSANSYLTSAVADKRRADNEELYKQLDQLSTTFDSMLTECQQAQPSTAGGN